MRVDRAMGNANDATVWVLDDGKRQPRSFVGRCMAARGEKRAIVLRRGEAHSVSGRRCLTICGSRQPQGP